MSEGGCEPPTSAQVPHEPLPHWHRLGNSHILTMYFSYISAFGDVFYCQQCHHVGLALSWKCTALLGELGHWSWCWPSADTEPLVQLQGEMFLMLKLCPVTAGFTFHLRGSLF